MEERGICFANGSGRPLAGELKKSIGMDGTMTREQSPQQLATKYEIASVLQDVAAIVFVVLIAAGRYRTGDKGEDNKTARFNVR